MEEFNVVLAGVGGQGILLAAEVLGTAALKEALDVRISEIHGMAQRGGAVISTVRIGENIFSPLILEGNADVILGFEPLETLRSTKYASEKTLIIMGDEVIPPPALTLKGETYPSMDEIVEKLKRFSKNIIVVETLRLAEKAGSLVVQNAVLLGALAATGKVPVKKESFVEALKELVPAEYVDMNVKAFELGYSYVKS
ncbi:MAG: indolepyruvate oxidoreductase subunit beta [Candidatus Bathyarchaeota archaeon]|nr:indolepyruvate oxidoreductase subunit beta [Candidatus Bathyarchaeota archaeon]MDW8040633.1 indolepyruvate oxidoreductase subunit beta [Nitrososphaerota archaeon]